MKDLGSRLTEFRKAKGLSQETLAEEAGISLRTLQRIEKEGTNPHGDTLKRIAEVLDISIDELVDHSLEINYNYIRGMHYSSLLFIIIPLANIILPVIFWMRKKDKVKDLSAYAINLINWQVTWSILTILPMAIIIPKFFFVSRNIAAVKTNSMIMLFPLAMILFNFIYTFIAGILVSEKYRNLFPASIRFLR